MFALHALEGNFFDKSLIICHLPEIHTKKRQKSGYVGTIRQYSPSLKEVHIVELVELHRELHCGLDFSHLGLYRQRYLTSSRIHL